MAIIPKEYTKNVELGSAKIYVMLKKLISIQECASNQLSEDNGGSIYISLISFIQIRKIRKTMKITIFKQ